MNPEKKPSEAEKKMQDVDKSEAKSSSSTSRSSGPSSPEKKVRCQDFELQEHLKNCENNIKRIAREMQRKHLEARQEELNRKVLMLEEEKKVIKRALAEKMAEGAVLWQKKSDDSSEKKAQ